MIVPASMLPVDILNCTASMALVVFPYPATEKSIEYPLPSVPCTLEIKCFTKVVDDGLNKVNTPDVLSSLSVPETKFNVKKFALCAKS